MVSTEIKLDLYETVLLTRRFEERLVEINKEGSIPGALHLGIGQEAFSAGTCLPLNKEDSLVFDHRGFGHVIGKGLNPGEILAEYMGKQGGASNGKGGVHLCKPELGISGISGCQGGNHVFAPGPALAAQLRGTDQVTACFFGDGTANRGTFLEGINLAAVWDLPVIFLCDNNFYGFSVPLQKEMAIEDIADRADGLGLPGKVIDGNDAIEVYETMTEAVERARAGEGPTLIEGKTYRWRGHHERDPGTAYRDEEEVEKWKEKDPVKKLRQVLDADANVSRDEVSEIEDRVESQVEEAVDYAENSPFPTEDQLCKGTFYSAAVGGQE